MRRRETNAEEEKDSNVRTRVCVNIYMTHYKLDKGKREGGNNVAEQALTIEAEENKYERGER